MVIKDYDWLWLGDGFSRGDASCRRQLYGWDWNFLL